MAKIHTVDPEGNVTLILRSINRPIRSPAIMPLKFEHRRAITLSDISGGSSSPSTEANSDEKGSSQHGPQPHDEGTSHIRVSSAHLSFAPTVFYALLHGCPFRESGQLLTHSCLTLSLPDDYPDGMLELMNAIHGKFRSVLDPVEPDVFMQMAPLVDKYLVHGVVAPLREISARYVEVYMPRFHHGEKTLHWMTMAYVFRMEKPFERMTGWLLRSGPFKVMTDHLPIQPVLDALITHKTTIIFQVFLTLSTLIHQYMTASTYRGGGRAVCRNNKAECDSMVFGSLLIQLKRADLYPFPEVKLPNSRASITTTPFTTSALQTNPPLINPKFNGAFFVPANTNSSPPTYTNSQTFPTGKHETTELPNEDEDEDGEIPFEDLEIEQIARKLAAIRVSSLCNIGSSWAQGNWVGDCRDRVIETVKRLLGDLEEKKLGELKLTETGIVSSVLDE